MRILNQERSNSGQKILFVFSDNFQVFDVLRLLGNKGRLDDIVVILLWVEIEQILEKD